MVRIRVICRGLSGVRYLHKPCYFNCFLLSCATICFLISELFAIFNLCVWTSCIMVKLLLPWIFMLASYIYLYQCCILAYAMLASYRYWGSFSYTQVLHFAFNANSPIAYIMG